ncbi:MAG: diguanylate cyclase [Rouxiella aceris]|uniref:GGDEF domain-containing protein n=1 Tax=Rouxiella aceris TaxID=2703884 RepID=UPI00285081FA|nr:diguanylate cyclase [Rouxiella aceris]MDR3433117.1 diguanylate cyclase [Rouxiella aceris]
MRALKRSYLHIANKLVSLGMIVSEPDAPLATVFNNRQKLLSVVLKSSVILLLTLLLSYLGISLRPFDALSIFWPVNAILLGFLIRYPSYDKSYQFFVMYLAMVLADYTTGNSINNAININVANIIYLVVTRALLLMRVPGESHRRTLQALIRVFPASFAGAACCALWGAAVSTPYNEDSFLAGLISWFTEQFSTSILFLPVMLSIPKRKNIDEFNQIIRRNNLFPLLSLAIALPSAIMVGGGGSLIFPLPALMWCAITYPLFVTSCLTLMVGAAEIMLVSVNILHIQGAVVFTVLDSLTSARLGIAAMAISPLIVAISQTSTVKLLSRLTQRADFDYLTGTLTRGGLYERLNYLSDAKTLKGYFRGAVMMIDIDNFKKINDAYGHSVGDQVLINIVAHIKSCLRSDILVCRMGGEEFLVVMFDLSPLGALTIAERIRHTIEVSPLDIHGESLDVTVSIGVEFIGGKGESALAEVINHGIEQADMQVYRAKRQGKNCVCSRDSAGALGYEI